MSFRRRPRWLRAGKRNPPKTNNPPLTKAAWAARREARQERNRRQRAEIPPYRLPGTVVRPDMVSILRAFDAE